MFVHKTALICISIFAFFFKSIASGFLNLVVQSTDSWKGYLYTPQFCIKDNKLSEFEAEVRRNAKLCEKRSHIHLHAIDQLYVQNSSDFTTLHFAFITHIRKLIDRVSFQNLRTKENKRFFTEKKRILKPKKRF